MHFNQHHLPVKRICGLKKKKKEEERLFQKMNALPLLVPPGVVAGCAQQGAAQHLFHSVPEPDSGGGVLP